MIVFCVISDVFAASIPGTIKLSDNDIFQTQFAGKTFTCGHVKGKWIPGRIVNKLFLSTKAEIAYLKNTIKNTRDAKSKQKLSNKQKQLQTQLIDGNTACSIGGGNTGGGGNFDSLGNLTEVGKAAFQVPTQLSASANRGIATWNSKCFGCHQTSPGSLRPNTFPAIKTRIQQSPMFFMIPDEVTEQEIADIVAYRNF